MRLADRLDAGTAYHAASRRRRPRSSGPRTAAWRRSRPTRSPRSSAACTRRCIESLGPKLYDARMDAGRARAAGPADPAEVLEREQTPLSAADRTRIAQEVADDILGHGPLEPFLRDPDVTEIMVNGPDPIYVERDGRICTRSTRRFDDEAHLRRTIDKIVGRVGRRVDEASPMVDARLPDGSRVNAVVAPIALDGAMLTIRKFARRPVQRRRPGGLRDLPARRAPSSSTPACAVGSTC